MVCKKAQELTAIPKSSEFPPKTKEACDHEDETGREKALGTQKEPGKGRLVASWRLWGWGVEGGGGIRGNLLEMEKKRKIN